MNLEEFLLAAQEVNEKGPNAFWVSTTRHISFWSVT